MNRLVATIALFALTLGFALPLNAAVVTRQLNSQLL
ncbi:hypothetical protein PLCT2_00460 [Planctomycetaceae bacterium]|nr:hypothetical protein PLCT2_00460 [Planctomycetaceae bacterium]